MKQADIKRPQPLRRLLRPDLDTFRRECVDARRPAVLAGAIEDWPALRDWTPQWLRQHHGDRPAVAHHSTPDYVPQEFFADPEVYAGESGGQGMRVVELPLRDLVDAVLGDFSSVPPGIYALPGCPVSKFCPDLAADFEAPEYCELLDRPIAYFWLGPAGKRVPAHRDGADGILAQIHGRKRLALASPEQSSFLYPHRENPLISEARDLLRPDLERFPKLARLERLQVDLAPGELLYIPQGWWHQVDYLDAAISLNFWPQDYLDD